MDGKIRISTLNNVKMKYKSRTESFNFGELRFQLIDNSNRSQGNARNVTEN